MQFASSTLSLSRLSIITAQLMDMQPNSDINLPSKLTKVIRHFIYFVYSSKSEIVQETLISNDDQ